MSTLNLNTVNTKIQYYISGKVVREDTGNNLAQGNSVHLIDNFPAVLFPKIELRKYN